MKVTLKEGKEVIFQLRHHWIFSGAIAKWPKNIEAGDFCAVESAKGNFLGYAYFNPKNSLCGRIVSFDETPPLIAIERAFKKAIDLRLNLYSKHSNTYRLVNGESDLLPGLIVDNYNDTLVLQIGTLGMEKIKPHLIELMLQHLSPKAIYEKSLLPTRKEEGLAFLEELLAGTLETPLMITEDDVNFEVDVRKGQKTGFFLDQREMRSWVRQLSKDKTILNCFSYTGGFTLAALKGGARKVDSVDSSETAIAQLQKNVSLNDFENQTSQAYIQDVFSFIEENSLQTYDFIILDPPAFAKKKKDIPNASKAYRKLNRETMKKMKVGSLLLTCSCSYHIGKDHFLNIIKEAALESGKQVKILGTHRLALDHPINLYHLESDYLKTILLYIDSR